MKTFQMFQEVRKGPLELLTSFYIFIDIRQPGPWALIPAKCASLIQLQANSGQRHSHYNAVGCVSEPSVFGCGRKRGVIEVALQQRGSHAARAAAEKVAAKEGSSAGFVKVFLS